MGNKRGKRKAERKKGREKREKPNTMMQSKLKVNGERKKRKRKNREKKDKLEEKEEGPIILE